MWTIFGVGMLRRTLQILPLVRAVYVAVNYNRRVEDLMLASLEHDCHHGFEVFHLTNYLAVWARRGI